MGKACGVIAAGSVLTALLCWVNLGLTADPVKPASANPPAAELLATGKTRYLNGKYAEAVQALEAAEAKAADLQESQRLDLEAYLKKARSRRDAETKSAGVTVRGQSAEPRLAKVPGTTPAGSSPEAMGRKLMDQARSAALRGDLRTAHDLAVRAKNFAVAWGPNETSPDQLLGSLRSMAPAGGAPAAAPAKEKTFPVNLSAENREANAKQWLETARGNFNRGHIAEARKGAQAVAKLGLKTRGWVDSPEKLMEDIARHEASEAGWKKDSTSPKSRRDRSKYLLSRSMDLIEEGETDLAIQYLQEAEKVPAERAIGDIKPEHVREELVRKGVHVPPAIAGARRPAAHVAEYAKPQPRPTAQVRPTPPAGDTKQKIATLMRTAHASLDKGYKGEAYMHAANAKRLAEFENVEFAEGEETPDAFIASLKADAQKYIAGNRRPAASAPAVAAAKPKATAPRTIEPAVVKETPAAREIPAAAEEPAVAKEMPAEDVPAIASEEPAGKSPAAESADPFTEPAEAAPAEMVAEDDTVPAKVLPAEEKVDPKTAARELIAAAKSDLEQGQVDAARAKAEKAREMDVAYDLTEETPEHVLAEIDSRSGKSLPVDGGKANHDKAVALLKAARQAVGAGKFDQARELANQAHTLNAAYDILEDTPEQVLYELGRKQKSSKGGVNPAHIAEAAPAEEPKTAQVVAEAPATSPRKLPEIGAPEEEHPVVEIAEAAAPEAPAPAETITEETAAPVELTEISPRGESAQDLYNAGVVALKKNQGAEAYRLFKQVAQSGERLSPAQARFVQEKLQGLGAKYGRSNVRLVSAQGTETEATVSETEPMDAATKAMDERSVAIQQLQRDVTNSIFRAERLTDEKRSDEALKLIDEALLKVENSNLDKEATKGVLARLATARNEVERKWKIEEPLVTQKKRNDEVKDEIKRNRQTQVRIEQELADMVKKYNELMDEKRFSDAEVIAKKAHLMAPENPTTMVMVEKAKLARQFYFNEDIKERKADLFTTALNDVDKSNTGSIADISFMEDIKKWTDLSRSRRDKFGRADGRQLSPSEQKIHKSLDQPISLHQQNAALGDVIKQITTLAQVNLHLDEQGLQEEGVSTANPVTINVDEVRIKSVLNLVLEPLNLGYIVQNDVLKITSRRRCSGELVTRNYTVADLVIPIPNFAPVGAMGMSSAGGPNGPRGGYNYPTGGQYSVDPSQKGYFQVPEDGKAPSQSPFPGATNSRRELGGGGTGADFGPLIDLITTTIDPDTWDDVGGAGSVREFETTLSLVVRQTQAVHDQISDLLAQLRRLQDLQVTVEVRFITVSDRFFERIGIDFDFDVQDNVGDNLPPTFGQELPPFGQGIRVPSAGTTGTTGTTGQTQTGTTGQTGTGSTGFQSGASRDLTDRDNYKKYGDIFGIDTTGQPRPDMDIPFQQGSFPIGVPKFGGFQPTAGLTVGLAILSDIETFFLISASQGDERNNLMFAPKVTLYNGQQASVSDTVQRPFVTSLIPTVGFFSVGFQPQITVISDGVTMQVQAVISADRRYVRLTVAPVFSTITDVQTFSFVGGAGSSTQSGQAQGGNTGGAQTGQGFGGGQFGQGGIGGITGQGGQQQGGQQQQGAAGVAGLANTQITVQQPVVEFITVGTTVSVPDGGTVLLGGIKRLREGRSMAGVPILNKIPYVSRLFKNTGVGRETESLMMMVTPRIIILEEEEELLGIPLN